MLISNLAILNETKKMHLLKVENNRMSKTY